MKTGNDSSYHNNSGVELENSISERNRLRKTERTEELAPNCQHPSPQKKKKPANEKATCQASSSSLSRNSLHFLCLPRFLCDGQGGWLPWQFQHSVSLCAPPALLSRHSFTANASSFCLFLPVLYFSPRAPYLKGLNEDMLLNGGAFWARWRKKGKVELLLSAPPHSVRFLVIEFRCALSVTLIFFFFFSKLSFKQNTKR